jgi:hypothetical protein
MYIMIGFPFPNRWIARSDLHFFDPLPEADCASTCASEAMTASVKTFAM